MPDILGDIVGEPTGIELLTSNYLMLTPLEPAATTRGLGPTGTSDRPTSSQHHAIRSVGNASESGRIRRSRERSAGNTRDERMRMQGNRGKARGMHVKGTVSRSGPRKSSPPRKHGPYQQAGA